MRYVKRHNGILDILVSGTELGKSISGLIFNITDRNVVSKLYQTFKSTDLNYNMAFYPA